jgi:predicted O-methyltransferase YrrM
VPALEVARHGTGQPRVGVDIGAGGGLGTLVIAKALPRAEIIAVEPSPGLRAVLLSGRSDRQGRMCP